MNVSHCLSSPCPGFNSQPQWSISRDFSLADHTCRPVLNQRGRKCLNLPSMASDNLWTSRRKAEVQPRTGTSRKQKYNICQLLGEVDTSYNGADVCSVGTTNEDHWASPHQKPDLGLCGLPLCHCEYELLAVILAPTDSTSLRPRRLVK